MSKTLGRVNLLALNEAKDRGLTGLDAWQAAAEAVVAQHMKELTGADEFQMGTFQIDNSKERAVIEAARAAKQTLTYYVRDTGSVKAANLLDALEALDSEEE